MYIEASTIIAIVVSGAFLWSFYSSEASAKKRNEEQARDSERREHERQLKNAKLSAEE